MRAVVLLFAVCLVHIAAPTAAHECVLGGTSASEITIYNSCKNDLIMGQSGHVQSSSGACRSLVLFRLIGLQSTLSDYDQVRPS